MTIVIISIPVLLGILCRTSTHFKQIKSQPMRRKIKQTLSLMVAIIFSFLCCGNFVFCQYYSWPLLLQNLYCISFLRPSYVNILTWSAYRLISLSLSSFSEDPIEEIF